MFQHNYKNKFPHLRRSHREAAQKCLSCLPKIRREVFFGQRFIDRVNSSSEMGSILRSSYRTQQTRMKCWPQGEKLNWNSTFILVNTKANNRYRVTTLTVIKTRKLEVCLKNKHIRFVSPILIIIWMFITHITHVIMRYRC